MSSTQVGRRINYLIGLIAGLRVYPFAVWSTQGLFRVVERVTPVSQSPRPDVLHGDRHIPRVLFPRVYARCCPTCTLASTLALHLMTHARHGSRTLSRNENMAFYTFSTSQPFSHGSGARSRAGCGRTAHRAFGRESRRQSTSGLAHRSQREAGGENRGQQAGVGAHEEVRHKSGAGTSEYLRRYPLTDQPRRADLKRVRPEDYGRKRRRRRTDLAGVHWSASWD